MKKISDMIIIFFLFFVANTNAAQVAINLIEFQKELQTLDSIMTTHCINGKRFNSKTVKTSLKKLMSLKIPASSNAFVEAYSKDVYVSRNRLVNLLNSYINKNAEDANHCDRYFLFINDLINRLNIYNNAESHYTFRLETRKLFDFHLEIIDSLRKEIDTIKFIVLTSDSTQHIKLDFLLNKNCPKTEPDTDTINNSILFTTKFSFLIQNDENLKELDFGMLKNFKSNESLWWGVDAAFVFGQSKKQLGLRLNLGIELDDVFSNYSLLLHGGPAFYVGSDEANSGFQINLSLFPDNGNIGFGFGFSTYQNILGINLLVPLD